MPAKDSLGRKVYEIDADINKLKKKLEKEIPKAAKAGGQKLQKALAGSLQVKKGLEVKIDTTKAKQTIDNFEKAMKTFWHKVEHYLTFTIGVQLVMRSVRALEKTIQLFTEFERQVTMVASVSGYFGKAFAVASESIEKFARDIGRRTVYSANEVAEAMYSIASAGYDVTQFTEDELIPILNYATAQGIDLNSAVEQVVRTFKEFGDQGETTSSIVDKFTAAITSSFLNARRLAEGLKYVGAMAGSVGVSLDETLAALATLVDRGYEGSQAGQRLNMILTRLLKPTREGEKVLQRLGLTIADVDPRVHSLAEILYKLRAAGFTAADAAQMFRARTAAAALTLVENADAVAMFSGQLSAAQGITEELAEKQMQTLWGALKHLNNVLVDVALSIGKELKPAILGIADAIENYFLPIAGALLTPFKAIASIFTGFGATSRITIAAFLSIAGAITGLIVILKLFSKILSIVPSGLLTTALTAERARVGLITLGKGAVYATNTLTGLSLSSKVLAQSFGVLLASSLALYGTFYYKLPSSVSAIISSFSTLYIMLGTLRNRVLSLKESLTLLAGVGLTAVAAGAAQQADTFQNRLIPGLIAVGGSALNAAIMLKALGISLSSLSGIGAIVFTVMSTLVTVFKDDLINALKEVGKALGIIPTEAELISRKLPEVKDAVKELSASFREWIQTTEDLRKAREDLDAIAASGGDTASQMDLINKLEEKQAEALRRIHSAWTKITAESSGMTGSLGKFVKIAKDWVSAEIEKGKLLDKSDELYNEMIKAQDEYNEAVAKFGKDSEEATSAYNRLKTVSEDYYETQDKISELEERIDSLYEDRDSLLSKMTAAEREYAESIWQVADAYTKSLWIINRISKLEQDLNTLAYIRENINKILTEKFADLAESEKKVLDIEEKLYKLRHDSVKRVRDLWDALVKEGWVTDELIEGRKNLEKSYGDMMKAQIKFSHLMDKLTPEQQKQLMEWIEAYEKALETGAKPPKPPEFLSPEEADIAKEYANAIAEYRDAVSKLESELKDFVSKLISSDVASSELADKYYELINAVNEIKVAENRLKETLMSQEDQFTSIVETIWDYWHSIYQSSSETSNMQGAFMAAASGLGIFTDALGDADAMLEYIRLALGDQTITWETLTEEQAVAALTIGKVGSAYLGLYRTMLSQNIIDLIPGVDSWDGFNSAVKNAKEKAIPNISSIEDAIENLKKDLEAISKTWTVTIEIKIKYPTIERAIVPGPLGLPMPIPPDWLKGRPGKRTITPEEAKKYGIPIGQFGGLIRKPTLLLAGEKGPELLLPLTNISRTAKLLSAFLPRYLPQLTGQAGGLFTPTYTTTSTTYSENWTITGPIYIQGVANAEEFLNELKYRARAAAP